MPSHGPHRRALAGLLTAAVGLAACDAPPQTPLEPDLGLSSRGGQAQPLAVYTQNLFHGGDTEPILTLDFDDLPAVVQEASVFWGDVEASDFPQRAIAIVDELEARMPHVVAFQEVFEVVTRDAAFQPIGGLDMLEVIEAEIRNRSLPYVTDVVQNNTSVTLPMGLDPGLPGVSLWLSVTDRVVSLRRSDVELLEVDQGEYAARLPLGPVTLTRGWARQSVVHAGETYHFVNTHLEVQQLAPLQIGQASELLNSVVAGLEGVTIIAGDLNSNAAGEPGDPSWTPTYSDFLSGGFIDLWDVAPPANRDPLGLTCCHDKTLTGDSPFEQRLDFVLVRSSRAENDRWARMRGHFRADITGEEDRDRTSGGLWPSDHAGIAGSLRHPRG